MLLVSTSYKSIVVLVIYKVGVNNDIGDFLRTAIARRLQRRGAIGRGWIWLIYVGARRAFYKVYIVLVVVLPILIVAFVVVVARYITIVVVAVLVVLLVVGSLVFVVPSTVSLLAVRTIVVVLFTTAFAIFAAFFTGGTVFLIGRWLIKGLVGLRRGRLA